MADVLPGVEDIGCPALAGIDPHVCERVGVCARLPRTRGDRPIIGLTFSLIFLAAPHSRG